MKYAATLMLFFYLNAAAYVIPDSLITDWKNPGSNVYKIPGVPVLNILDFGGKNDSSEQNNTAMRKAVNALGSDGGTIYFPAGNYRFDSTIHINRDKVVLSGAGADSSKLYFNLNNRDNNCIQFSGSTTSVTTTILQTALKDSRSVIVASVSGFSVGDWIFVKQNDSTFFTSNWSFGKFIQIAQIDSITGNRIVLNKPLRHTFYLSLSPSVQKINPRKNIGIECVRITRLDQPSTGQASIIYMQYAVNSWIKGIESEKCFFAHVCMEFSSNISVLNSYFHDAFNYGGGGRAYGCAIQFSSSNNLIQNNVFKHLRHGILLQAAPNGNVIGYNFLTDPYWTEPLLPANSAGQLVLHGNYPFANLFEGNIAENLVIDDSHGLNGPYNTFFRNRIGQFGIFMNNGIANRTNFIANENTGLFYTISGNNNFLYGNNNRGSLSPSNITSLPDTSYYLSSLPPDFWTLTSNLPTIGYPVTYNTGTIPAKARFAATPLTPFSCDFACAPDAPSVDMQEVYQVFSGDTILLHFTADSILEWTYSGQYIDVEFRTDTILIITDSSTTSGVLSFKKTNICGSGPELSCTIIVDTRPVGIAYNSAHLMKIFPNPVAERFTIRLEKNHGFYYQIINLLGEEIIHGTSNENIISVDLSGKQHGIYFLLCKELSSGYQYSYKLIKQ
jgi:hypothetical protein